jgi:formylglycine-generating enzyme required for sulfatase activity
MRFVSQEQWVCFVERPSRGRRRHGFSGLSRLLLPRILLALLPLLASAASPAVACTLGEELIENGITYVHICGGTFTMGSAASDLQAADDEKPAHEATLHEFWLGKTEVTNQQYRRFRPDHKGEDDLPATEVSWEDARAACAFFGGRLPTEAEWENAARAGNSSTWPFDEEKQLGEYAWYGENSDNKPHAVGTRKPNPWNLADMHGNVWEWVADWYGKYPSSTQNDPSGPATGEYRVLRGGSFVSNNPWSLRPAFRIAGKPSERLKIFGFRCARDSHQPESSTPAPITPPKVGAASSP